MTRTGLAYPVMPDCARTVPYRPVLTEVRSRVFPALLAAVRMAHPSRLRSGSAFVEPAARPLSGRSRRSRSVRPPRAETPYAPCPRPPALAHRLHAHLRWRSASLPSCSRDPGRDISLCLLSSPLRPLQWP